MANKKLKFIFLLLKILIFLLHIALLGWIIFALKEGGLLTTATLTWHFVGIALSGAGLIRISAFVGKKEMEILNK